MQVVLNVTQDWVLAPTKLEVKKDMLAMIEQMESEADAGDKLSAIDTCFGILRLNTLCPSIIQSLILGKIAFFYYQLRQWSEASRYAKLALEPQWKFTSVNHRLQLTTVINQNNDQQKIR